jgi:hypothetical protein
MSEQELTLQSLTSQWKEAKRQEQEAEDRRLQIEYQLYTLLKPQLPQKGTFTTETGMKIALGMSEKWDQGKLNEIHQTWDGSLKFPFKGEWKADGKAISYLRDNVPGLYRTLSDALTLTEKKPAFSVKGE